MWSRTLWLLFDLKRGTHIELHSDLAETLRLCNLKVSNSELMDLELRFSRKGKHI